MTTTDYKDAKGKVVATVFVDDPETIEANVNKYVKDKKLHISYVEFYPDSAASTQMRIAVRWGGTDTKILTVTSNGADWHGTKAMNHPVVRVLGTDWFCAVNKIL